MENLLRGPTVLGYSELYSDQLKESDGGDEAVEDGEDVEDAILPEARFVDVVPPSVGGFQLESNHRIRWQSHLKSINQSINLLSFPISLIFLMKGQAVDSGWGILYGLAAVCFFSGLGVSFRRLRTPHAPWHLHASVLFYHTCVLIQPSPFFYYYYYYYCYTCMQPNFPKLLINVGLYIVTIIAYVMLI